jgi:phosphoribosylanthranilate isomerase
MAGRAHYACITGITNQSQAYAVCSYFTYYGFSDSREHAGSIGLLASCYTRPRAGKVDDTPPKTKRYVHFVEVPQILRAVHRQNPGIMPAIHYWTNNPSNLAHEVREMLEYGGISNLVGGLQFNMDWPEPGEIYDVKQHFGRISIILPITNNMLHEKDVAEQVRKRYGGCGIDHILIDPSGGRQSEFPIRRSAGVYAELSREMPDVNIGIAGGIAPGNISRVREFQGQISVELSSNRIIPISVDVEGGVRDGDDNIDLKKCQIVVSDLADLLL